MASKSQGFIHGDDAIKCLIMPNDQDKLNDLRLTAANWSPGELDHLLSALKRDRTLDAKDLVRYVRKKSVSQVITIVCLFLIRSQIRDLFHCILSCPEEYLTGHANVVRAESTIDILSETTKHMSPDSYSNHCAVSDALNQYAAELERRSQDVRNSADQDSSTSSMAPAVEIRYSELYRFFSAATQNGPLPALNASESAAVLDLLACLVCVMQSAQNEIEISSKPNNSDVVSSSTSQTEGGSLHTVWNSVSNRITEQIGIYLATCAAHQWTPSFFSWIDQASHNALIREHPIAPYFILGESRPPKSLKATKAMMLLLIKGLVHLWSFPHLSTELQGNHSATLSDLSQKNFQLLVKRLNAFTLNPFSLTRREMAPFNRLLNTVLMSDMVSAVPFYQLLGMAERTSYSGVLIPSVPPTVKPPTVRKLAVKQRVNRCPKTADKNQPPKKRARTEGLKTAVRCVVPPVSCCCSQCIPFEWYRQFVIDQ
ncbi:hypothetical protein D915_009866 [Fasciola hepatica]|uniref:Uncharacterized protein n=1 Tax=Fasciola hepatica TaxID=6192 RepID=A0A4E0RDS5_FASHE|nr:hypothetical protein D915_009866 [Fasciola hepatica]